MLNINSLNNVRDQKEINKHQIYKKVLDRCYHRIKTISQKGDSFGVFVIPEYIFGIPKFDTLNCANYIINKLKINQFKVIYTYPNLLFISWEHIPSEIYNSKKKPENKKKSIENISIEKPKFRYKTDYNPSSNFLNKIN
uniref:Uncharacterized protein n=1 Tax=viral metagenome TaxID=1070528 RepID=A0A6C0J1D4_9ZZZZ